MLLKKISVGLLTSALLISSLAGCSSKTSTPITTATASSSSTSAEPAATAKKHFKFGATYMTMNNPFFVALNDGIKKVVEANGDSLVTLDPALDQNKQISQIEDLIAQKVDAIFLNPVDWKGVKPALDEAKKLVSLSLMLMPLYLI